MSRLLQLINKVQFTKCCRGCLGNMGGYTSRFIVRAWVIVDELFQIS